MIVQFSSASVSGDSAEAGKASGSKGPGPAKALAKAEVKWKSCSESMEYLLAIHAGLYPSPMARELKGRIQALHRGFHTQEKLRANSYLQKRELGRNQCGFSRKKRKLHEQ